MSGREITGPSSSNRIDSYSGATGPDSFGSGTGAVANSGAGDKVGIDDVGDDHPQIDVPHGYVSEAPLSDNRSGRGQLHGPDWNCGP